MTDIAVKRGDRVTFKPEWRDAGDDNWTFVAVTDPNPFTGGFYTSTVENTFHFRPQSPARVDMVESAVAWLPVITITFVGLEKRGALVKMRRMLGDRELSLTYEVIARSTFRQTWRRGAADCKPGQELQSGVEFPPERPGHAESKG